MAKITWLRRVYHYKITTFAKREAFTNNSTLLWCGGIYRWSTTNTIKIPYFATLKMFWTPRRNSYSCDLCSFRDCIMKARSEKIKMVFLVLVVGKLDQLMCYFYVSQNGYPCVPKGFPPHFTIITRIVTLDIVANINKHTFSNLTWLI